jgi:hypothetical protein
VSTFTLIDPSTWRPSGSDSSPRFESAGRHRRGHCPSQLPVQRSAAVRKPKRERNPRSGFLTASATRAEQKGHPRENRRPCATARLSPPAEISGEETTEKQRDHWMPKSQIRSQGRTPGLTVRERHGFRGRHRPVRRGPINLSRPPVTPTKDPSFVKCREVEADRPSTAEFIENL